MTLSACARRSDYFFLAAFLAAFLGAFLVAFLGAAFLAAFFFVAIVLRFSYVLHGTITVLLSN